MNAKQKNTLMRIIVAAVLMAVLSLLPLKQYPVLRFVLFLVPYFTVGHDILRKALKGIKNRQVFDENFLMAAATIGAMALGEYTEGVAVMLFYQIGELFQSWAVGKSRRNISDLMDIRPDYANLETGDGIEKTDRQKNRHRKEQFKNRLFDRDTLLLFHYDVNFLFVLSLYARDNASQKATWKQKVRNRFRHEIQEWLQDDFEFYAMTAKKGVDAKQYFRTHFQNILGKTYTPFVDTSIYSLALDKEDPEGNNEELKAELGKYFILQPCKLGENPKVILKPEIEKEQQKSIMPSQWLTMHYLERDPSRGVLVGFYKNEEHLRWMLGGNDQGTLIYNVRLKLRNDDNVRDGAHSEGFYRSQNIQFVILYTEGAENTGEYRVFHVKDVAGKVSEERMLKTGYPLEVHGNYFFFRFDEEVNIGRLNLKQLLFDLKKKHLDLFGSYVAHEPLFTTANDVMGYRNGFEYT